MMSEVVDHGTPVLDGVTSARMVPISETLKKGVGRLIMGAGLTVVWNLITSFTNDSKSI
jgi:hypothetical protein